MSFQGIFDNKLNNYYSYIHEICTSYNFHQISPLHYETSRSIEQWKKPWLFGLYRDEILLSYVGIKINHEIRIPIQQPIRISWFISCGDYNWPWNKDPYIYHYKGSRHQTTSIPWKVRDPGVFFVAQFFLAGRLGWDLCCSLVLHAAESGEPGVPFLPNNWFSNLGFQAKLIHNPLSVT